MKKVTLSLIIAAVVALLLFGCGQTTDSVPVEQSVPEETVEIPEEISEVTALPGYVVYNGGISPNQMWGWSDRYHAGWEADSGIPTAFPYSIFPYGK